MEAFTKAMTFGALLLLLRNMERLGVDAARIEAIVISHAHSDHTSGVAALLSLGIHPALYVLRAFPEGSVEAFAGSLVPIHAEPGQEIVPGIRTPGVVGEDAIPEQALVLDTRDGPVVLTGCAHPGPLPMAAFQGAFGDGYLPLGVGRVIRLPRS